MAISLSKIEQASKLLRDYNGENPFILRTKNTVVGRGIRGINDFEAEYVLMNHDKEPREINKIVKIADWYGRQQQIEWVTEFVPQKLKITWYMGETSTMYHFFCIYRRSQDRALELFVPKKAVLTDFLSEDWHDKEIDFSKYSQRCGRELFPHQKDAVRFLTSKKRAILADSMGFGKTTSAIVSALEDGYKKVLVICPASVKMTWKKELSLFVDENDVTIVEGRNWQENRFTIINYDILKNFYEVPTETIKQRELDLDESGRVINVTKEKEIVSRKQAVINEAMENSQLFQSRFDLIIVDEAHRLSNTSSGIFKIVTDLVKRSQPKGIYAITGTPITNRPINFFNILKVIDAPLSKDWKYYVERYCDGKSFFKKNERSAYTAIFLRDHHKRSWNELTKSEQIEMYDFLEKKCKKVWVTNGASNLDELKEVIKPYYLRRDKNDLKLVEKRVTTVEYELEDGEKIEYDKAWDEYLKEKEANKNLPYKPLMEGIVFRQWLANTMCQRTISLVRKMVDSGLKVVVFCTFDEELHTIRDAFGESCVVHNGKLTMKKKDEAVEKFQNDPSIKVFIGNIKSAGVGLTLTEATRVVFNSITFVPGDMQQAEDRIHRLNQTKPCEIYYQIFKDTYMEHMFGIVHDKSEIINTIIIREDEK